MPSMERRSALYLLTDRAVGGRLEDLLSRWAQAGVSKRAAAALLALEIGGIEISSETIRRWMAEVTIGEAAVPSCGCGKFRRLDEKTGRCLLCGEWPEAPNGDTEAA